MSLAQTEWDRADTATVGGLAEGLSSADLQRLRARADDHRAAGEVGAALGIYQQIVDAMEARYGPRDRRLIAPLRELGLTAADAGSYGVAMPALQRSAFLARTNFGLHSREQLETEGALVESYLALGLDDAVAQRARIRPMIEAGASGVGSEQHLRALEEAGALLQRVQRFEEDKTLQEQRIRLLSEQHGPNAPEVVPGLVALAANYRLRGDASIEGLQPLQRARTILSRAKGVTPADQARVYAAEGDHYLAFDQVAQARNRYRRAYGVLIRAGKSDLAASMFATPQLLAARNTDVPGLIGLDPRPGIATGPLRLELDIGFRGGVREVRVIERPDGLDDAALNSILRSLRFSRFRPRLSRDGPERVEGMSYTVQVPVSATLAAGVK